MRCVRTMRASTEGIVRNWAKGTNGKIIDPIPNDQDMPDDEYFYWGILRGSGDMIKRGGHDYYFCDHAYFKAGHKNNPNWYRVTKMQTLILLLLNKILTDMNSILNKI